MSIEFQNVLENPWVVGITCTLIGFMFRKITDYISGLRGYLSGRWYGVALDNEGNILKYDVYYVRHSKDALFVTGKRLYPKDQTNRTWDFYGAYRDRTVCGFFRSLDPQINSLGCVLLKNDNNTKVLTGYYMTHYEKTVSGGDYSEVVGTVNYKWCKEFDDSFSRLNNFKEPRIWQNLKLSFFQQRRM
ncbi:MULTISPECIES: hypothetical protein [Pseudoalteromonas]|uniref:Uncharacterized protein n=1 Tax=Pseudoalteromonas amylolytica TaxID=1859457 RepID=A0A1S1MZA9_9GAMM|nr:MULTISPECIES: hypothetical protein [Pseudoalteromonas]OHU84115.1 hypothetical protein BFC16_01890 [Pseudoalteromonas sp. JW3]OHU92373.1 hypothetical protein BET10_05865 [Pseudoalteromonas amylolytica]